MRILTAAGLFFLFPALAGATCTLSDLTGEYRIADADARFTAEGYAEVACADGPGGGTIDVRVQDGRLVILGHCYFGNLIAEWRVPEMAVEAGEGSTVVLKLDSTKIGELLSTQLQAKLSFSTSADGSGQAGLLNFMCNGVNYGTRINFEFVRLQKDGFSRFHGTAVKRDAGL